MHRAAGNLNSRFYCLSLGVEAAEAGQESRVNVDDFMFVMGNKLAAQKTHEAGQAQEVCFIRRNGVENELFKGILANELLAVSDDE